MMADLIREQARVPVREESDVMVVRKRLRELAAQVGLPVSATEALATATTEIARNILVHAKHGEVLLGSARGGSRYGVAVVARDWGPGIPDLEAALRDGYSTVKGLGLGLSSAKRLVDEFEVVSFVGEGTIVMMKKWVP